MNTKILLLSFVLLLVANLGFTQKMSWKKHKKVADELFNNGKYADAAEHYEDAWRKKNKKKELIFKAGESYYLVKDYKKAAECFENVKNDNETYDLVGLKYARSLKQSGHYDRASQAFVNFINSYKGSHKKTLNNIIQNEIQGCELGIRTANESNPDIELNHIGANLNTPEHEFAPIPFEDDLLYFTSTMRGKAAIYRSQKKTGKWTKASPAKGLPKMADMHIANGSFTPDVSRFYFTQCIESNKGEGLNSRCDIFVIKRKGSGWSSPEKLREYINDPKSTTTHPYIVHQDGQEILYFASDRDGGKGGMDIWYAVRKLNSNDIDFTFPKNAGKTVNTAGDELTPYYDEKEGVLYFSSNGQIGIGGMDVFKTQGNKSKWQEPKNMGVPINSSTDDFYFRLSPTRKGGFLASNRLYGMDKISTRHEDIFEFKSMAYETKELLVKGSVLDDDNNKPVENVNIMLFEIMEDGQERLLYTLASDDGNFELVALPSKKLKIKVEKEGYTDDSVEFNTSSSVLEYKQTLYLKNRNSLANETSRFDTATASNSNSDMPTDFIKLEDKNTTKSRNNKTESAAISEGTYYKIQLIALRNHDEAHRRYKGVKDLGRLDTEYITGKSLTRVLLADFPSKSEARSMLKEVHKKGFARAFLVKYQDGSRVGRTK